ncbi:MAG: Lrp/AsnC family transcriptional regulator [Candidatus Micrarchaeota archaeon]|nr:Lrp/AsnC family transcriptional regulator [Candidatus Micrarchaeota archaeon]
MDATDESILEELRKDAKVSLKQLARQLGIPLTTVYSRIGRLERGGIIRRYRIEIDWKKIGYGIKAYVFVYLDYRKMKEKKKTQKDIVRLLNGLPFVEEAESVTGDVDIIMRVRAKDSPDLGRVLMQYVQNIEGIDRTRAFISMEE